MNDADSHDDRIDIKLVRSSPSGFPATLQAAMLHCRRPGTEAVIFIHLVNRGLRPPRFTKALFCQSAVHGREVFQNRSDHANVVSIPIRRDVECLTAEILSRIWRRCRVTCRPMSNLQPTCQPMKAIVDLTPEEALKARLNQPRVTLEEMQAQDERVRRASEEFSRDAKNAISNSGRKSAAVG